jgi:2,3-dihydroxy-2,3-dihydro-p-cumate dehydrogenase
MKVDLQGQVALITGAASPIGKAITKRFVATGAHLILADLVGDALREVANESAPTATLFSGDLAKEEVVAELFEIANKTQGRVDVLVNNAGGGIIRPFLEHTPETMRATIDRNLWTALWCCRQVVPMMVTQGYGRVISIGADSVRNGLFDHAVYNAAKGGVHAMTTGLAREFAKYDITFNVVAPCMIETPIVIAARAAGNPMVQKMTDVIPKGRPGEPDEVASMVLYLAQREAAFVTGQVISVNGGSTML